MPSARTRLLVIACLGGVAITHLADLPHKLLEAPYLAALFIGLIYLYSSLRRTDYVMITAIAMMFAIMTSYTRARAEGLNPQTNRPACSSKKSRCAARSHRPGT